MESMVVYGRGTDKLKETILKARVGKQTIRYGTP